MPCSSDQSTAINPPHCTPFSAVQEETELEDSEPMPAPSAGSSSDSKEQDHPTEEDGSHSLMPGEKQTFEYNHKSRLPILEGLPNEGFQPREVFDYNHQPPPWRMGMGPPGPPPPIGPPPPFPPDPHWGPPPGPPPPRMPPPIPYFDLPAGIMVALVPVSYC